MKKVYFTVLFVFMLNAVFSQNKAAFSTEELRFQNVETLGKSIPVNEIHTYKIIDSITKPEAYLIRNFDNKIGTLSIAIKNNEVFHVYELFSSGYVMDTLNAKEKSKAYRMITEPSLEIVDVKRCKLDNFKSEELIVKFSYTRVGCPDCNQTQATIINGYILFDFDKLQLLKLINLDRTTLAQNLMNLKDLEGFKVEFMDGYVKMKKRKYYYKDNKLIAN
ncbi:hypothetical protein [Flavobacterium sp. CAU 1735]|uniref:hypothetical protein n=1 Tax=Flavobacterium sp. CAU 1735 TaxID=3140361 RepID=UPI003260997C